MTKTELKSILSQTRNMVKQINHCQAWISAEFEMEVDGMVRQCYVLRSYWTQVALAYYEEERDMVKVFTDERYSATTTQHCHKFAKRICEVHGLSPYKYDMNRLYAHSGMRKAEVEQALATDFAC